MLSGDCNVCINGKLPSYSATCVECGLSRKNFKPVTNADRIRSMTDEELASYITGVWYGFEELPGMCDVCDKNSVQNCGECWLDWLKQEAT